MPDGDAVAPWLLTVAHNLARNAERQARRQGTLVDPLAEPEDVAALGATAERVVQREQLFGALTALKEIDRELILLVAWDGLSPAQAGAVLGLRPGAARSRLHRTRNQLAGLMGVAATSRRQTVTHSAGPPAKEDRR